MLENIVAIFRIGLALEYHVYFHAEYRDASAWKFVDFDTRSLVNGHTNLFYFGKITMVCSILQSISIIPTRVQLRNAQNRFLADFTLKIFAVWCCWYMDANYTKRAKEKATNSNYHTDRTSQLCPRITLSSGHLNLIVQLKHSQHQNGSKSQNMFPIFWYTVQRY